MFGGQVTPPPHGREVGRVYNVGTMGVSVVLGSGGPVGKLPGKMGYSVTVRYTPFTW